MLDDYHVITADPIHRGMTFLLEHLPPQLHLILATRADPPLPTGPAASARAALRGACRRLTLWTPPKRARFCRR